MDRTRVRPRHPVPRRDPIGKVPELVSQGRHADLVFHPWHALRALTSWTLLWSAPASGARAEVHWPSRTITMDPLLLQAERRSALTHELGHIERGPFPCWATDREERAVDATAARRLIDIRALGDALVWSQDPHEVAEELWVDVPTLEARIAHLHPSERHYLRRRLERKEP